MKKVAAIFAVVVLTFGFISCDAEATTQDDTVYDVQACTDCEVKTNGKD